MFEALGRTVAAGCVVLIGCSTTTYYSVDRVLADLRRDEAAATTKLGKEVVGLEGEVKRKGRTTEDAVTAANGLEALLGGSGEGELGYVVLEGTTPEPGQVIALFDPRDVDRLAPVRVGEMVTLSCDFRGVMGARPNRAPLFEHCYVETER